MLPAIPLLERLLHIGVEMSAEDESEQVGSGFVAPVPSDRVAALIYLHGYYISRVDDLIRAGKEQSAAGDDAVMDAASCQRALREIAGLESR